jgi:beta-glucosidase
MAQATLTFPRGFLWGCATSSHQVEGQNRNNNWHTWQEEGQIFNGDTPGLACDWWGGRWREDFDRAAESGQNAHRLSLEWSRIQPTPDRWDEDALDHYREMVRGLTNRGMTPIVTLHHFTDPKWIAEKGGWENKETIDQFIPYVEKVVEALGDYVTLWCTINEPNVYATLGYLTGQFPPGKEDLGTMLRVMANLVHGHAAAYHAIHRIQLESRAGLAVNYRGMDPARKWHPLDRIMAWLQSKTFNDFFPTAARSGRLRFPHKITAVPEARGTQDFLGINYYTQERIAFSFQHAEEQYSHRTYDPQSQLSETGFIAHKPEGMFRALKWGEGFGVPILITENGIEDSTDKIRPQYIVEHIHQVWKGINHNWPIKGYFHWTLVDNFEWERGWSQRFGLYGLDPDTQTRTRRKSADLYEKICRHNELSSKMVESHAPQSLEKLFPG